MRTVRSMNTCLFYYGYFTFKPLKCFVLYKIKRTLLICIYLYFGLFLKIQYSLFLKECGVAANEAILFWQQEYSKASKHRTCKHDWYNNASRYVYNIRHLYGLEGSRKNYRAHSCQSLQVSQCMGLGNLFSNRKPQTQVSIR